MQLDLSFIDAAEERDFVVWKLGAARHDQLHKMLMVFSAVALAKMSASGHVQPALVAMVFIAISTLLYLTLGLKQVRWAAACCM